MTNDGGSRRLPGSAALRVEELTVRYGGRVVFEGFSLNLSAGEKATVTGRSGSGKSTLLRCVVGFVCPSAGSIHIKGERVSPTAIWHLRRAIAYVPQEPELGTGAVRSILYEPFGYRANAGLRGNLARIPELFGHLSLPSGLLDQEMSSLSGGEKQRVAIVGALLLERDILLLDEAASALDEQARSALTELLMAQEHTTILSAAHDATDLPLAGNVLTLQGKEHESTRHDSLGHDNH